ncbi:MAG: hypothetical protein A2284_18290 [Deltaproteobacteria bacterium RIFOXYA12_FULL_61_11]|nr:MAG: hypothetical protein A2284_18290 [Deltaproteobacteria bacterium RIFOXYA12_FULL_61_11]
MVMELKGPLTALGNLEKTRNQLLDLSRKMASGKRIERASDDAAVMAMVEGFTTEINEYNKARDNLSSGLAVLNTADGAASEVGNILQRQRELALQASNGVLSDRDRNTLNVEFQALNEELDRISSQTSFNGQPLLNGQGLGSGSTTVAVGENQHIALPSMDLRTSALGVSSLDLSTQEGAANALEGLDSALSEVMNTRAAIGAKSNQLGSALTTVENQLVHAEETRSKMRDLDYAEAVSMQTRLQLQTKAAMKTLKTENDTLRASLESLLK